MLMLMFFYYFITIFVEQEYLFWLSVLVLFLIFALFHRKTLMNNDLTILDYVEDYSLL